MKRGFECEGDMRRTGNILEWKNVRLEAKPDSISLGIVNDAVTYPGDTPFSAAHVRHVLHEMGHALLRIQLVR